MSSLPQPILIDEALARIDSEIPVASPRRLPLKDADGCALAESVVAPHDQPALDQSSIDGFALAEGSSLDDYAITGEWLPGQPPAPAAPPAGEACRVYTGTPLPPGCGLVLVEETESEGARVKTRTAASPGWIRHQGGSVRAGAELLATGTRIGPGETAVLASVGLTRPLIHPRPQVLHLTTGSEIVPADAEAAPWQIRDSNGPLIRSLVTGHGLGSVEGGHVDESVGNLIRAVESAGPFDFLFLSGGSSVGRYDNSARALNEMGFETVFHRVRSRPGKPLLFARRGNQWAFGIPGNPVAHFVVFQVFLRRALGRFMGLPGIPLRKARLAQVIKASGDGRETFWPARLQFSDTVLEASPRPWVHSGDLAALRGIDALIRFSGSTEANAGDTVSVLPCLPDFPGC